jgi:hypothetical protein
LKWCYQGGNYAMEDKSLKSSEEYIRTKIDSIKRDFDDQVHSLHHNHDLALSKWKDNSGLIDALEAAYSEELAQLKKSFSTSVEELQGEVDSLVTVNSLRIRRHPGDLKSMIYELFLRINRPTLLVLSIALLRTEHFFK